MTKQMAVLFLWVNAFFLVLNSAFIFVAANPTINFLCAIMSLGGLMASWLLYTQAEHD
jgi:hypothetical protein